MAHSLFDKIRERLIEYLADETSLEEFHDWFAPVIWSVEESDDKAAEELAYAIELILSEFTKGDLTKHEFKRELLSLLTTPFAFSCTVTLAYGSQPLVAIAGTINGGGVPSMPAIRTGMQSSTGCV
jgi:hypothetical protein